MLEKPFVPGEVLVALDTCIYRGHRWNFEHKFFVAIQYLVEQGEITLLRPELVEREVYRQLERRMSKNEARNIISPFGIQSRHSEALRLVVENEMIAAAAAYERFHWGSGSISVPTSYADISGIMDDYFERSPPFGEGDPNIPVKNEFPDAVLVSCLKSIGKTGDNLVVLISSDKRVLQCGDDQSLSVVKDLGGLLQLLERSEEDLDRDRVVEAVQASLSAAIVGAQIESEVVGRPVEFDDWNHESEEIVANQCKVDDIYGVEILSVERIESEYQVEVTLQFHACVNLHATIANVEFLQYDRESGRYLGLENLTARFDYDFEEICYLTLACCSRTLNHFRVTRVELDQNTLVLNRSVAEFHAHRKASLGAYEPDYEDFR